MKILDLAGYVRRKQKATDISKQVQVPKLVQAKVAAALIYEDRKEREDRPKMTDIYVQMLAAGLEAVESMERTTVAGYPLKDFAPVKHESAPILFIPEEINDAVKRIQQRFPEVKSVVPIINRLIEIGCELTPTKTVK